MPKIYGGRWKGIGNDFGRGGQGNILRVEDTTKAHLGEFALKQIINPKRTERFRNEVEAIKTLVHPNVIRIIDHSALDALPNEKDKQYLVMPIARNGDLSRVVSRYQNNVDRMLAVARQIADALSAAHDKKIIHRDVKPENLLFPGDDDCVWVSDFGLCLIRDGRNRQTATGEPVGPIMFMAPELEGGGQLNVTEDVDIYSLGKVMYYMLTGGVRLPRERFNEEPYARVLVGAGLASLRLLLSQMICPHDRRLHSMKTVIERLDQIAKEREGNQSGFLPEGLQALDRLKQSLAQKRADVGEQLEAATKADHLLDTVHESILSTIKAILEASANQMRMPEAINSDVRWIRATGLTFTKGPSKVQAIDGFEVTYQEATNPHARIFALQFFFYRKATVRIGHSPLKVGVFARLELREASGRPVTRCSANLQRRLMSRGRYEYAVTDEAPAAFEFELSDSGERMNELRQFILETVSAFPELVSRNAQQFTLMRLGKGKR